jgi:hypothetical protein
MAGWFSASAVTVKSGGDLASIIMEANEGDTVQIEAGLYQIDPEIESQGIKTNLGAGIE